MRARHAHARTHTQHAHRSKLTKLSGNRDARRALSAEMAGLIEAEMGLTAKKGGGGGGSAKKKGVKGAAAAAGKKAAAK